MAELLGTHSYQLDPKGRVSLPARFREAFADGVWLTHRPGRLPLLLPQGRMGAAVRRGRVLPPFRRRRPRLRAVFFGSSDEAKLDGQGRVTIPQRLRDAVGIPKEVVVLGVRDRMEIWDRESYERYDGPTPAPIRPATSTPGGTHDTEQARHRGSSEPVPDRDGRRSRCCASIGLGLLAGHIG